MYRMYDEALTVLQEAGRIGDIDPGVMDVLAAPSRILHFRIPLKHDDGSRRLYQAYRVRYNDALGPYRDGTRVSPTLDMDEVQALGLLMSIKHAAGRIPAGGGKGGINADPGKLSRNEYERLCRGYIRMLQPAGPGFDVPGADIGTGPEQMAWMLDEYEQITRQHAPAAINDKPAILGGAQGGTEATGRGVFDTLMRTLETLNRDPADCSVALQGFGQVGSEAAEMLQKTGASVVAVADSTSGVANDKGLDITALRRHQDNGGILEAFSGGSPLDKELILEQDCDILIPAAVQGVINEQNVSRIRARVIVEAANAPTTVKADKTLQKAGVTIVPDVIANSGSVHVCQMERTQGLCDDYWDADRVGDLRRERVLSAYDRALETATKYDVSARLGAWINALKQLEQAIHARGWR